MTKSPLNRFPIVSTTDVNEAQSILSREMSSLRIQRIRHPNRFHLTMNGVRLGKTQVAYNRFSEETDIEVGTIEEAVILTIGIGAPTIVELDGVPNSPDIGSITSPHRRLKIHREAGSEILILRTTIDAIEERYREVMGRLPDGPIRFDNSIGLSTGLGLNVKQLMQFVVDTTKDRVSTLDFPLLRTGLDDLLMNALLSLPSSVSEQIARFRDVRLAPAIVRKAEEFMESNATEPISISDVVKECGCSRRALFLAFRRYRSCTPMQFLADVRLNLARTALLNSSSFDTVTTVAYSCGFFHLGRFAKNYSKRFGEHPSETLRNSADRRP